MLIVMREGCGTAEIGGLIGRIRELGHEPRLVGTSPRATLCIAGSVEPRGAEELMERLRRLPDVREVESFESSWKLASRELVGRSTSVRVAGGLRLGSGPPKLIAGPCAVESRDSILRIAEGVARRGAHMLRGGAFKPRTSPYSFRGLGEEGLRHLEEASRSTGLPVVTEVLSPGDVGLVAGHADMLQVGARNMQNYSLLEAVGDTDVPVLLKRGMTASIRELLLAAEYVLARGNPRVVLCERGIRTFETMTRNTLDISAVPLLKRMTHLPVVVDPSHGTGVRELVVPVGLAAVAAGADGLMVEVHDRPEEALSDGPQSIGFRALEELHTRLARVHRAVTEEGGTDAAAAG
jgi:3-deoxy-7-phosphoheptulonate synthase